MNPLSISTGVVAVATLAASVCSSIASLRSLCNSLPGRIHAVNNEVTDLELVLMQVALLIKERSCLPENRETSLPHLLKHATEKLLQLKELIEYLTRAYKDSRATIVAATAWRKEQKNLQDLQEEIKNVKCNLNIMLGVSNSYDPSLSAIILPPLFSLPFFGSYFKLSSFC